MRQPLLLRPHSPGSPEAIRVWVPTVWVEQCTQDFHKAIETNASLAQATGSMNDIWTTWYASIGIFQESPKEGKTQVEIIIEMLSQLGLWSTRRNHSWNWHKLKRSSSWDFGKTQSWRLSPFHRNSREDKRGSWSDDPEELRLSQEANVYQGECQSLCKQYKCCQTTPDTQESGLEPDSLIWGRGS